MPSPCSCYPIRNLKLLSSVHYVSVQFWFLQIDYLVCGWSYQTVAIEVYERRDRLQKSQLQFGNESLKLCYCPGISYKILCFYQSSLSSHNRFCRQSVANGHLQNKSLVYQFKGSVSGLIGYNLFLSFLLNIDKQRYRKMCFLIAVRMCYMRLKFDYLTMNFSII